MLMAHGQNSETMYEHDDEDDLGEREQKEKDVLESVKEIHS